MSNIPDAYLAAPHKHVSVEGGIFSGKGLLSSPLALFMVQATIIISLSRIIHRFLMPLRQPQVIAEIIENIFPSSSLPTLNLIASFGLVLYMFLMGLELDTGLLFRGISKFLIIGTAGIILPGILGSIVSLGLYEFLLEPEKRDATPFSSFLLFTFAAFAITAFPVLARILTEKKLLSTSVGLMTISAAAMGDIFAW
uniref:Cation/H+ exchanger domain-containing protein n=1 Tax=Acrobeloides nanus TaxID=290746 RepID=A0A914DUA4_9BILA